MLMISLKYVCCSDLISIFIACEAAWTHVEVFSQAVLKIQNNKAEYRDLHSSCLFLSLEES